MNSLLRYLLLISVFLEAVSFLGAQETDVNGLRIDFMAVDHLHGCGQFQSTLVDPEKITAIGNNHYLIDFGKDAFGTLIIKSESPQSEPLVVHLGEKLSNSTAIDRNPGGTIRYQRVELSNLTINKEYTIILPPDPLNTNDRAIALPDSFGVITPFRYCELENLNIPISDITVTQKVYHYQFDDHSSDFTSSDTILNQVWDLCKYTMKATSFAGVYIDGDRERIPYEADAYINQLSHYSVDNEYSMARRTNEYFMNHPTWPTEWILHTVLLFYHEFLYTGNVEPVSRHYEGLKYKTLLDLEREDGLISSQSEKATDEFMGRLGFEDPTQRIRDIVDWPPSQSETGWKLATKEGERDGYEMLEFNTVVNSFHYINLKLMAELAGFLGKNEDSVFYHNRSVMVKEAINVKLMDHHKGIYLDGENSLHSSLHANMFPLAFGIVPEKNVKTVIAFIKSRGMACSVYGAQFLLEGLYNYGEADFALGLLTSTSDRSWWNMIRTGSTIALEAWDMKYKPNADWNHAWGAAPANIIVRHLWGIIPAKPGFSEVQIKPQLSRLSSCKIKVPTIKGAINAEYESTGANRGVFVFELPPGMKAELVIVDREAREIFVNNRIIKDNGYPILLNAGVSKIQIE